MNILITSAGQRVSLIRAFKTELLKFTKNGKLYTTDLRPELSAACNESDGYFKCKPVVHADYIAELLQICLDNKILIVVPTIDTELKSLAENKDLFKLHKIHVIISSLEFINICRDKRKTSVFFKALGIAVPKEIDKNKPVFPLFIKPYDGSLSSDTFVITKPEELNSYHMNNEKLLFMEYIDPADSDEFTVDMYYSRTGELKCLVPRKRISVRAGEISKGLTCKNILLNYLKEKLNKIDGAIGCITLQAFLNKQTNEIIAIEINPRFGGGYPLSYLAGAAYPSFLIREYFFNEEIAYTEEWEENLLMLRYDGEILVHGYKYQNK